MVEKINVKQFSAKFSGIATKPEQETKALHFRVIRFMFEAGN